MLDWIRPDKELDSEVDVTFGGAKTSSDFENLNSGPNSVES